MASYDEADVKRRIMQAWLENREDGYKILADLQIKVGLPQDLATAFVAYERTRIIAWDGYSAFVLGDLGDKPREARKAARCRYDAIMNEAYKPLVAALAQYIGAH